MAEGHTQAEWQTQQRPLGRFQVHVFPTMTALDGACRAAMPRGDTLQGKREAEAFVVWGMSLFSKR